MFIQISRKIVLSFLGVFIAFIAAIPGFCLDEFDVEESELFGDESMIESASNVYSEDTNLNIRDQEGVSLSGAIYSKGSYYINRDWMRGNGGFDNNVLSAYGYGDLFFDIRLQKGHKAFIDIGYYSLAPTSNSQASSSMLEVVTFKELFVDLNFGEYLFTRVGKQVLRWGRSYLWNPTDLINVEKKNYFDMSLTRSGTYGVKIHQPIGLDQNFYAFFNVNQVNNLDDVSIATKYEFVVGSSEFAISLLTRRSSTPVCGFDFSTRLLGFDLMGELMFIDGSRVSVVKKSNGIPYQTSFSTSYQPRATITFMKTFDWELQDRISLVGELFYNSTGYNDNIFNDPTLLQTLYAAGFLQSNYVSRLYAAVFGTITKFPSMEMSTTVSFLRNMVDESMIFSFGTSYTPVFNFILSLNSNIYLGESSTEYGRAGFGMDLSGSVGITF